MLRDIWRLLRTIIRRKTAEQFLRYKQVRQEWLMLISEETLMGRDLKNVAAEEFHRFINAERR